MTAAATTLVRIRRLPGRWPSFRVVEVTARGGYRNSFEFSRSDEARACAARTASKLGVKVEWAE